MKVVCVKNLTGLVKSPEVVRALTIGKIYDVIRGEIPKRKDTASNLQILDDEGKLRHLGSDFFITLEKHRDIQLNKILK